MPRVFRTQDYDAETSLGMLINRASCSVFRGALGHESAGVVNGPGLRPARRADRTGGLRISGGAPIFDLRARSGVLAILRSINCPPGGGPDPSEPEGARSCLC